MCNMGSFVLTGNDKECSQGETSGTIAFSLDWLILKCLLCTCILGDHKNIHRPISNPNGYLAIPWKPCFGAGSPVHLRMAVEIKSISIFNAAVAPP